MRSSVTFFKLLVKRGFLSGGFSIMERDLDMTFSTRDIATSDKVCGEDITSLLLLLKEQLLISEVNNMFNE